MWNFNNKNNISWQTFNNEDCYQEARAQTFYRFFVAVESVICIYVVSLPNIILVKLYHAIKMKSITLKLAYLNTDCHNPLEKTYFLPNIILHVVIAI